MKKQQVFNIIKKQLNKNYILVLFVFVFISLFITISIGINQSVWFDEAYSINLAKRSMSEIIRLTSVDVHPPLYYILLHFWGSVFGWSGLALRLLSAIFMAGSLFVGGILTKKLFGLRAMYFVIPILAFSPILMRYGFEIRMYSLASLIGITATYFLVRYVNSRQAKERHVNLAVYAVLVALGMFTLYYMALLWLAHFCWLVWMTIKEKWSIIKSGWIFAYLGSVLLFLVWLPSFLKQMSGGALAPISQAMTIENLIGVISFNFLYRPVWQLGAIFAPVVVCIIIIISRMTYLTIKKLGIKNKSYLMLMAMYVLVPVLILMIIGLFKPVYTERYLSHIVIGGLIYVGVILSIATRGRGVKSYAIAFLVVAFLGFGVLRLFEVGNYNFQRLQKPDTKTAFGFVSKCSNQEVVLAADPYVAIELGYYLDDSCDLYFYSKDKILGGGYAPLSNSSFRVYDIQNRLSNMNVIYYAYYGEPKLLIPSDLVLKESINAGGLIVEKYSI